jgi:hypothetical protein
MLEPQSKLGENGKGEARAVIYEISDDGYKLMLYALNMTGDELKKGSKFLPPAG